MSSHDYTVVAGLWGLWVVYWTLMAWQVKPARRHESVLKSATHLVPLAVAGIMVGWPHPDWGWLTSPSLAPDIVKTGAGWLLIVAGLLFTVWARVRLGRNWSGIVTLKQDHELVRSGPYRWVRHPIYTGLLLAVAGTALIVGQWRGVMGWAIVFASFWFKLRREERWMLEVFGEQYSDYRRHTKAIVPGVL